MSKEEQIEIKKHLVMICPFCGEIFSGVDGREGGGNGGVISGDPRFTRATFPIRSGTGPNAAFTQARLLLAG